jgi:hypothetical protein
MINSRGRLSNSEVLCVDDELEEELEPDDAIVVARVEAEEELEDDDWVVVCVGALVVVRLGVCATGAVGSSVFNFLRLPQQERQLKGPLRFMAKADVVSAASVRPNNNLLRVFMITSFLLIKN